MARVLTRQIEGFGRLDVLLLDELGYLPIDAHRATLFLQLVSHLHTQTLMINRSTVPFDRWGSVFADDTVIAAAILDRLLHFSHVFAMTRPSCRTRGKPPPQLDPRPPRSIMPAHV